MDGWMERPTETCTIMYILEFWVTATPIIIVSVESLGALWAHSTVFHTYILLMGRGNFNLFCLIIFFFRFEGVVKILEQQD